MIDQMKKNLSRGRFSLKSLTAMVLFGAIIIVFVLSFQGQQGEMGVGAAARVNNTLISIAEFRSESEKMEQMYGQFFGGQINNDMRRQFINGQALENLIMSELIAQGAKEQGILATNAEVQDYVINEMPVFKKDGKFQREVYFQLLEANRLTPKEFEEKIRKEMKTQKVRRFFEATTSPLNLELQKLKMLKENKINVGFIKIDENSLVEQIPIPETEINQQLQNADFMKKVEADFSANKANYSTPEEVRASHILIKFKAGDEKTEKSAEEKINKIKARLKNEDFGKVAAEVSEDEPSKKKKGDLGFFSRGRMVAEFENAAFSLPLNTVSDPVKTQYGYHLIKVAEKKAAVEASLDNTKKKIAKKLLAQEKLNKDLKDVEELLQKGQFDQLEGRMKAMGLGWEETGFVSMDTEQLPKLSSVIASQAAYELNDKKKYLPRLVRDGSAKFVLRLNGAKKEDVKDAQVTLSQLGRERMSEAFMSWVDSVKKSSVIEKNPVVISGQ